MKLVCDTNVVFSALIAGGKTRELVLNDDTDLHAPEFFFTELDGHRQEILSKSGLPEREFDLLLDVLFGDTTIVPRAEFETELPPARDLIEDTDPDDVPFLALALHLDAGVWSDDGDFEAQDAVEIWKTHELVERLLE